MKRAICFLISLLTLSACYAEQPTLLDNHIITLNGYISEVYEEKRFLIHDQFGRDICVILDAETIVETSVTPLEVGHFVFVDIADIHTIKGVEEVQANRVYGSWIDGLVIGIDEASILIQTKGTGDVRVILPEPSASPFAGEMVRIFYNGIVRLSIPMQIEAAAYEVIADEFARPA